MAKSINPKFHVVARAVRLEYKENSDDVFVVFKVVDEQFKKQVLQDWNKDVELQVIGTDLVKEKE